MKKKLNKSQLMDKYNIKSIGGGQWGKGFVECLRTIDDRYIEVFENDHVVKRIEFAEKNKLPYSWLLNQLRNDWKRGIGKKRLK